MRETRKRLPEVATLCGFSVSYLNWQCSRGFPSVRVRARIEDKLNVAIFNTPAAFALRQQQKALLGGLDPVFATRAELQARARKVGLTGATHFPNRRTLVEQLVARCAAVNRPTVHSTSSRPHHD